MKKVRVLVLGAGGVGVYFGGRLAQGGAEVSVVARSDYEAVKRQGGYHISSIAGDFTFVPAAVLHSASEFEGVADYVILSSKVLPEVRAVSLLQPVVLSSSTTIVQIQNGIDIEREIADAFPGNVLLSTIAYIGVSRPAPGNVLHQGSGMLKMGRYPSGIGKEAERLAELFAAGGVQCELYENIGRVRWQKLLWNLPFNPVSVLSGGADTRAMTNGDGLEALCRALMEETARVAQACGENFDAGDLDAMMDYTRNFPPYKTSMLQDYEAGRPLEVEAILGNAVRLAEKHGLSVPRMECCYALLKSVDQNRQRNKK